MDCHKIYAKLRALTFNKSTLGSTSDVRNLFSLQNLRVQISFFQQNYKYVLKSFHGQKLRDIDLFAVCNQLRNNGDQRHNLFL